MTREAIMIEFALRHVTHGGGYSADAADWSINAMADEIVRLRAILAMLKQPSEKILLAAVEAVPYGASYAALMHCIPAAVAAAEQEVSA